MRGFYNVNFKIPGFSFPPFESYPVTEISDADVYRYFESRGGTRYRLNRARTSYGELRADGMFMNYGYPTFTGYTVNGTVSGTDGLNQTRFTMTPTTITLKSKGYDHFTVTDHVRVLTNLVVDNSTLTKTLTTQFDTTTNSLSVTTFTRTNTLSVHDGSSTRFLNVSAYTNTHTLSVKDLTTTKTLSTLNGSFTWWLNVSAHTNTETLSVKDLTTTKTLSTLNGSYTWWLNVSAHTNTHTLSTKTLTTTETLSVLSGSYTNFLNVLNHTNTRTLSVKDLTFTNFLSTLSGTYSNFLEVLHNTNTETLSVEEKTTTDTLDVLHHTNTKSLSVQEHTETYSARARTADIVNSLTVGSGSLGTPLNYIYHDSSGYIEVDNKVYYSAEVVDHMMQWLSGMGDRIYTWMQTGNYNNRHTMSYPASANNAYQAQKIWIDGGYEGI